MNYTNDDRNRDYALSNAKYELQMQEAAERRLQQVILSVAFFLIVVAALYLFFESVLPDLAWCHENYAIDRIPHCYFYENSIWGRFINPAGITLPW